MYSYNTTTWKVLVGKSEVQSHPPPHCEFEVSLGVISSIHSCQHIEQTT